MRPRPSGGIGVHKELCRNGVPGSGDTIGALRISSTQPKCWISGCLRNVV